MNTDVPNVPRTEVTYTCKSPRETLAKQDHQMLRNLVRNRHGYLHMSVRRLQVCLSTARWDWTDFEQPPKKRKANLNSVTCPKVPKPAEQLCAVLWEAAYG